jgi:hypothetical protein
MYFIIRCALLAVLSVGSLVLCAASEKASIPMERFISAKTDCVLWDGNVGNPYAVASYFLVPGQRIDLEVLGNHTSSTHDLVIADGVLERSGNGWSWTAPSNPGLYTGRIGHSHATEATTVNFFVMVPISQLRDSSLDGYPIGRYPSPMAGREALYRTPDGFVQVTPENEDTLVAPHFTLRQFLCKQESGYPKYVVLEERLLIALETVLEHVNRKGYQASSLFVMSGYRTPAYNRSIGNVPNSRHVFGDAADIFVDQNPTDGIMDDLNGDGRSDRSDNGILARIVEEALGSYNRDFRQGRRFVGGIGNYPSNSVHGPFVHVDLRGYRARW